MTIAARNLLADWRSHFCVKHTTCTPPISLGRGVNPLHFVILPHRASSQLKLDSFLTHRWRLRVFEADEAFHREKRVLNQFSFDTFLSMVEALCLASSAVLSIGCAVSWAFLSSHKSIPVALLNRALLWQSVLLVGAVGIGALVRRRQWRRICRGSSRPGGSDFNLIERIEKLEDELRNSATIIRVLSRQLEKLGVRFRVTRKALKEPITETAALAQKNSEATRALAVQEDNLEKELGEVQKVLLAMQEQQQKQLELVLAVGKVGKVRESKQEIAKEKGTSEPCNEVAEEAVKWM